MTTRTKALLLVLLCLAVVNMACDSDSEDIDWGDPADAPTNDDYEEYVHDPQCITWSCDESGDVCWCQDYAD